MRSPPLSFRSGPIVTLVLGLLGAAAPRLQAQVVLNEILAKACGQTVEKVARDVDRDYIMGPEQALEYGMIDHVIATRGVMPIK